MDAVVIGRSCADIILIIFSLVNYSRVPSRLSLRRSV